jgi:hypothetical protein
MEDWAVENRHAKKLSAKQTAFPFLKKQIRLFFIGLAAITAGYIALAQGPWNSFASLTLAPILLVAAYVVLIPLSILKRGKD